MHKGVAKIGMIHDKAKKQGNELKDIIIYEDESGLPFVEVKLHEDNLYLSLNQIAALFDRDKSVISRHLTNIFKESELEEESTVAFFATVQNEGGRPTVRKIEHYNLDAIISVGYRVNSKQGTRFRKWATKVLNSFMLSGFAVNHTALTYNKIKEIEQTLELLSKTLINQHLVSDIGEGVIELIYNYAKTWSLLLQYDEDKLDIRNDTSICKNLVDLNYSQAKQAIKKLKEELGEKGEASDLFGLERESSLQAILGNLSQTFDSKSLYPSNLERAAHLLYFVIKDHPFSDGNKRIGAFLFLTFLNLSKINSVEISNSCMTALTLLIAESDPKQKDIMIKLVMKMLVSE
jgi:prophage maintenance system killer protein